VVDLMVKPWPTLTRLRDIAMENEAQRWKVEVGLGEETRCPRGTGDEITRHVDEFESWRLDDAGTGRRRRTVRCKWSGAERAGQEGGRSEEAAGQVIPHATTVRWWPSGRLRRTTAAALRN
jgi:hypothetical protein